MSIHLKSLARKTQPETVALFPLSGAVLLPGCDLPLNVFEPRYLNMVDDALKADRLIGMVQPQKGASEKDGFGSLYKTGGLGRIMQFAETEDGRYMIVLKGLRRFTILGHKETSTPYALANVGYEDYPDDENIHDLPDTPEAFGDPNARSALTMAMKAYAKTLGVELDWDALKDIRLKQLVDQAAMISPFDPEDKQSLLEAHSHEERRRLLIGLMHLYSGKGDATVQ